MHIVDWIIVALFSLGLLLNVAQVGKPRKPLEPGTAAVIVAVNVALIIGVLWSHGALA